MVVTRTDMILRYSGGLSNCTSALSLGGMISTAACGTVKTNVIHNVFDTVSNTDLINSIVGTYNYRCLYLFNINPANETLQNVSIWIELNTTSPFTDVDIGLGLANVGEIEQTIPNENTPPKFVAWSTARDESMALFIGNIPADKWKAIWIRRHAGPAPSGSSYPNDSYRLRYKCHGVGIPAPPPAPGPSPPSPPPPPPGSPPPPPPTPPPTGSRDVFDITKIYPDKVGTVATGVSKPWFMNAPDLNNNCFFDAQQTIQKNADNSWKNTNPTVRFQIYISDVPDCSKTIINAAVNGFLDSYNHDIWADRGYIYKAWDWRNVEFTCFFKIVNAGTIPVGSSGLALEVRGVKHSSAIAGGCGGSAYKAVVRDDGNVFFTKKHFHDSTVTCGDSSNSPTINSGVGSLRNKWVGVKYMVWNYTDPGTNDIAVHMELWIDKDGDDTWQKVTEINDTGAWYAGMPSSSCAGDVFCGGSQDQIISWASPICGISTDGYPQVDFEWASVREIQIPTVSPPPPPPPPTPSGKLSISSITAKGHDGNVPANVNDGSLSTRWSHSPVPTWIKLNLGSIKTITGVKIAWYNGTTRRMGFKIEGENTGAANVVDAYAGTSSGTSTQLETYNFHTAISRQYITIHVLTNSDAGNLWGSITEVEVFGSTPSPPSPPPGSPPGSPPPPPPTTSTNYIQYFGGPIMNRTNPAVYLIFWGSEWNTGTPATVKADITSHIQSIINSDYYKGLWQYGNVKTPIYASSVVHTTTPTSIVPADGYTTTHLAMVALAAMTAGQVPNPDSFVGPTVGDISGFDFNHIYIVFVPPNIKMRPVEGDPIFVGAGIQSFKRTGTQTNAAYALVGMTYIPTLFPTSTYANQIRSMQATFTHETVGNLSSPYATLVPQENRNGYNFKMSGLPSGFFPGDTLVKDNATSTDLSGTTIRVARYWSDRDGKEIAPGTGDTWTSPTTPPPAPDLAKDVFNTNKIYATKPGSTEWAATMWANNKSRTISNVPAGCTKDPYDSKLSVDRAGDPVVTINGTGILKVNGPRSGGTSCRVVVLGTWQNVESTVYVRCPSSTLGSGIIDLRSKTDHYCISTGDFGGYVHHLNFDDQRVYFKKEKSHAIGYSARTAEQNLTLSANIWIGVKAICYNLPDGDVKVETWIDTTDGVNGGNWVKRTESIDDGTWIGVGAGNPDTKPCGGSSIRSDTNVTNGYLEYKKWTIREISPPT